MTPQELIRDCQRQLDIYGEGARTGLFIRGAGAELFIRGYWKENNYRTLFGVRGKIILEQKNRILVRFPAKELKEAVEKALAAKIEANDEL